jgi:hypothetical protein
MAKKRMRAKNTGLRVPSALLHVLEYVVVTDRTPPYRMNEANVRGDLPLEGTSWQTPREYALELAKQFGENNLDSRPAMPNREK